MLSQLKFCLSFKRHSSLYFVSLKIGHGQLNSIKSVQSLVEVITIVSFKDLI